MEKKVEPTKEVSQGGLTRREFLRRARNSGIAALATPVVAPFFSPKPFQFKDGNPDESEITAATAQTRDFTKEVLANKENLGPFANRVGWAYSAKPELSVNQMVIDMQKMRDLGSNIIYISHINPGYIDHMPPEPGLNFAVYYALENNTSSKTNAEQLLGGVNRSLEAARKVGLPVVLAIGYQIQMGTDWTAINRDQIRRDFDGSPLTFWGNEVTASPYSPRFKQDVQAYYQWVDDNILRQNPNILALNLGDEPMGSDYSSWAKEAFRERYGVNFDSADPYLKGKFQAGVLADYASWGAALWKRINPNVKTLHTFHIQRDKPFFPSWEAIFSQTPENFVFSNDTHIHDDLPEKPLTESERNLLYGMVRTISWLSRVYGKGFLPWLGVNGWSLANLSSHKGGVAEAKESLRVVTDVAKQDGGLIPMIMTWGWNINSQGIFGYNNLPFNPTEMAQVVSSGLSERRDTLTDQQDGRPDIVYYVDPKQLYTRIGQDNVSRFSPKWVDLNQFDFIKQNAIWLCDDGPALDLARQMGSEIIKVDLN